MVVASARRENDRIDPVVRKTFNKFDEVLADSAPCLRLKDLIVEPHAEPAIR